jgi:hypothetical protein
LSTCAGAVYLEEIDPGREVLVDHVVRIDGREAVALDQDLTLRIQ